MLTINRELLLSRMEVAAKVCPTRPTKDILKWAKLDCDGESLVITATDLEIGVVMKSPCAGQPGAFLLPAAQTVDVLRAMHSEQLTVEARENQCVEIYGNGDSVRLPHMPVEEFPEWTHDEQVTTTLMWLSGPVGRTEWAISKEAARYAIGGFHLKTYPEGLFLETTDSRCLAREPVVCSGVANVWHGVVEPRGMLLAARILAGDIHASLGKTSVLLSAGGFLVYARLLEGRYPDVTYAIPRKFEAECEIPVGELARVVKLASTVTDKESRGVDIAVENGVLSAKSGGMDLGSAAIEVPVVCEKRCKTSLDATFLANMLSTLESTDILKWGMNKLSANLFSVKDWTGVIMPFARDE